MLEMSKVLSGILERFDVGLVVAGKELFNVDVCEGGDFMVTGGRRVEKVR